MKRILFLLFIGTFSVHAAPSVSGVSGTLTHGQTLTISGSSFGTKSTAAPLIFDTFESGSFNGSWANTTGLSINSDNNRTNSTKNAFHNFKTGTSNDMHNAYFTAGNTVYPTWHVSYWFKLGTNWDWGSAAYPAAPKFLANIKLFRLWNPGSTNQNFVLATEGYDGTKPVQYGTENVGSFTHTMQNFETYMSKGSWHHFQFDYTENSALGASDGVFKMWFDGALISSNSSLNTRSSAANTTDGLNYKRPFIIGFYNSWEPTEGTSEPDNEPNHFFMDNVYMDNSWARVEIGNASTYSACTIREEQLPSAWSSTSITVTYQEGELPGTKYLYVVDSAGVPNSSGFLLNADSTPPTVSITAPSGGSTISGSAVSVTANASDDVGVVGVQFKVDDTNLGAEDTSAPYSTTYDTTGTPNGTKSLTAVARDASGNSTTSSAVSVTVSNAAPSATKTGVNNVTFRGAALR